MNARSDNDNLIVSVSGIRGRAGTALGPREAFEFGCAFGTLLGPGSSVALGSDPRPSGTMIKNGVAAGLMGCGVDVIHLGIATTPGTGIMTETLNCDGGVVITASHNPVDQNGIKFLQSSGGSQPVGRMKEIEKIRQSGKFNFQDSPKIGKETQNGRTHDTHVNRVLPLIDLTGISSRRFRVALDAVNGAGCTGAATLLSKLGCEMFQVNCEPDGQFGRGPEPVAENLADLCNSVRQNNADIGFALDPDGDRLTVVDETGYFPGEEYTLVLAALYTLSHRKGNIAANLSTSRMIDDVARKHGVQTVRTPTGEANVAEAMKSKGCILGGEGNGGVIDPRVSWIRDSFTAMVLILQLIYETGKTLSQLAGEIPAYHLIKEKITVPEDADKALAAVKKAFSEDREAKINQSDGIRIDFPDRWILARKSNTEPIIRIFSEAPDVDSAESMLQKAMAAIKKG